jgi:biopolymer transport protein ExbD
MRRGLPEPAGERIPNLAPMVDIIMVLLVFFMLGASLNLIREGALEIELDPRSGPGEGAPVELIPSVKIGLEDIDHGAGCHIYVMGAPLEGDSFEALEKYLAQRRGSGADPSNPVVIGAQSDVHWKFVIRAMDASVKAGFANVQFAVSFGGS